MLPEERDMLERVLQISEQNNRILRKIHREAVIRKFTRVIYLIVIIAIALVTYYYIKPYTTDVLKAFKTVDEIKSMYVPE